MVHPRLWLKSVLAMLVLLAVSQVTLAAWTIQQPTQNDRYLDTATIASSGQADVNQQFIVKLWQGTVIIDSHVGMVSPLGMWAHNFSPQPAYPAGNTILKLYHGSVFKKSVGFRITASN